MKHIKLTADDLLNGLSITFDPSKSSPKPFEVDWTKVPKYTPILVRDCDDGMWKPRFLGDYNPLQDRPFKVHFGMHSPYTPFRPATTWKQAKIDWLAENAWLPWIDGVRDLYALPNIPHDTVVLIKFKDSGVTMLRTPNIFTSTHKEFYYMIPSQIKDEEQLK